MPEYYESYKSYSQHILRDITVSLSSYKDIDLSSELIDPEEWKISCKEYYIFYKNMLQDMFDNPEAYELPIDTYPKEAKQYDRDISEYLSLSKIRDPELKYLIQHNKSNNMARKAIYTFLDFILLLGGRSELNKDRLQIDKDILKDLKFINVIERLGFSCQTKYTLITLHNCKYPNMLLAFNLLSKKCLNNKKLRHLFYRCDFRALDTSFKWALNDQIQTLSPLLGEEIVDLDSILKLKGYRFRLESESSRAYILDSKVVLRILFNADQIHIYFRWILNADKSKIFFEILYNNSPVLCKKVFEELIPCRTDCNPGYGAQSSEDCGARAYIEHNGHQRYTCKDAGWHIWGNTEEDFENIKIVAEIIYDIIKNKI